MSALEQADEPQNLVFAIGSQYKKGEIPDLSIFNPEQVRVKHFGIEGRPGLTRIRYLVTQLFYNNEKYFLQLDSHMRFEKGWDTYYKRSLNSLGDKVILTGVTIPGEWGDEAVIPIPVGKIRHFKKGILTLGRDMENMPISPMGEGAFYKSFYIQAAILFTYGKFIKEVGFDPYSQFKGEETVIAWKAFMCGWDVYHTSIRYIHHEPEEYFDKIWNGDSATRTYQSDEHEDKSYISLLFQSLAFVYNDYSYYALKNAVRTPKEWLFELGADEDKYKEIRDHFDAYIHSNLDRSNYAILRI
jgi:hypothetical protein